MSHILHIHIQLLENLIDNMLPQALAVDPSYVTFFSYLSQRRGPFSTSPLALRFDRLNRAYWAYRELAHDYPSDVAA